MLKYGMIILSHAGGGSPVAPIKVEELYPQPHQILAFHDVLHPQVRANGHYPV